MSREQETTRRVRGDKVEETQGYPERGGGVIRIKLSKKGDRLLWMKRLFR